MTDFSSISFSDISQHNSEQNFTAGTNDIDVILGRLGATLNEVKQLNGEGTHIFARLSQLLKQSQQKLQASRQQNLQAHRKCLEHIEILLYQQDYAEALQKISYYKNAQLKDLSFEGISLSPQKTQNPCGQDISNINFQQAKAIIASQFSDLNLKQQIWLKYALMQQETDEQLTHVTTEEVQEAIFANFRKQFQIQQQITQLGEIQAKTVTTPQKKNCKSASHLKSSAKNKKSNKSMNMIVKQSKSNEKSGVKLGNPSTRQSEKRTCRKNAGKMANQSSTAKKVNSPSAFMV